MGSYQQVDVFVTTSDELETPLEGVMVKVFDETGTSFFTQAVTDDDGHVGFLLYTQKYTLRFYRFQVSFQQPQLIEVLEGPGGAPVQNQFNVRGEVVTPPIATDPRLCRASGYFRDITGAPHPFLDIIFIGEFAPILLEGAGVLSERRFIRTDENGFACVDLIRCAIYKATVEGSENCLRQVKVPDSSSVNLPDLLFPLVSSVTYDPSGPFTVASGSSLEVVPTVIASSKVPLSGTATADVIWSTEDPTIATVSASQDTLTILGVSPGTTKLLVKRIDGSVLHIPETEISGSGVDIVVT